MRHVTIEKAEAELNRISELRKEMLLYKNSPLKNVMLLSCDLCEEVWKRTLCILRRDLAMATEKTPARVPAKKIKAAAEGSELLTRRQLEKMAFDIRTSDAVAQKALIALIRQRSMN